MKHSLKDKTIKVENRCDFKEIEWRLGGASKGQCEAVPLWWLTVLRTDYHGDHRNLHMGSHCIDTHAWVQVKAGDNWITSVVRLTVLYQCQLPGFSIVLSAEREVPSVRAVSLSSPGPLLLFEPLSHVWLFCDPVDCSPPGFSVHGISQVGILECVAIFFSRGSSWPRNRTRGSCIDRWVLYHLSHQGSPSGALLRIRAWKIASQQLEGTVPKR